MCDEQVFFVVRDGKEIVAFFCDEQIARHYLLKRLEDE